MWKFDLAGFELGIVQYHAHIYYHLTLQPPYLGVAHLVMPVLPLAVLSALRRSGVVAVPLLPHDTCAARARAGAPRGPSAPTPVHRRRSLARLYALTTVTPLESRGAKGFLERWRGGCTFFSPHDVPSAGGMCVSTQPLPSRKQMRFSQSSAKIIFWIKCTQVTRPKPQKKGETERWADCISKQVT